MFSIVEKQPHWPGDVSDDDMAVRSVSENDSVSASEGGFSDMGAELGMKTVAVVVRRISNRDSTEQLDDDWVQPQTPTA